MRLVMTSLAIAVAGYAAGASAADPSAVLQQSTGRVFVGQTATMIKAQPGMPLYAGNRVVAAAGGGAKVIYPDGCAVSLPENSALAVGKPDQCKAGQATIYTVGGFQNARIGQAGPVNSGEAVATVGEIKGNGLVNKTGATPGMSLYKGNQVTAGADSRIVVRYLNGCEVVVESGKKMVVNEQPVCTPDLMVGGGGVVVGSTAAGGTATGVGAGVAGATIGGISTGMVVGGLALASAVALGVSSSNDSDNPPASPQALSN
jgi:hypothetical protein